MKFRVTQEMRKHMWMSIMIIASGIAIFFFFEKFSSLWDSVKQVCSLLTPFILGFAIAFLLNKPMMWIESKLQAKLPLKKHSCRTLAAVISIILGILVVGSFMAMIVPQLIASITSLIRDFPGYVQETQDFILSVMKKNGIDMELVANALTHDQLLTQVTKFITDALPQMLQYTYWLGSALLNILLGIMAALYMMIDKERLLGYARRITYAVFPRTVSIYFHRMAITSSDIFNNFIVGKAIDSLIIGILCYVGSLIFNFPYALLLSVFVGVTNMIPVFGPFIGAIPGVVILFIIHPVTSLYFALFVFVLQQFDGNVLGPLILGDKLGLPSIGILFSVCVGGGLFGVLGMFIGVPCFAILYTAIREFVNHRLRMKGLSAKDLVYDQANMDEVETI